MALLSLLRVPLQRTPSSEWSSESVKAAQQRLQIKYNRADVATVPLYNFNNVRQQLITCYLLILKTITVSVT